MASYESMWKANGLDGTIAEMTAEGPPDRALVLTLVLRNRFEVPVILWRSRVTASLGNVRVAEGDLLHATFAAIEPLVLRPGDENASADIRVPITREALAHVERFRRGHVELGLTAYCSLVPVMEDGRLGLPWENVVSAPHGNTFGKRKIAASDWVEYLQSWGYADIELVEIAGEERSGRLAAAWKRWDEAVVAFRSGEYENTLASCYRSVEAAARVATPQNKARADLKALGALLQSKQAIYDPIFKAFTDLLHKGRHDQASAGLTPDRRDALFALGVLHSILRRLG